MTDGRADVGRTEVYACELAAFDGTDLEDVRPIDEIATLVQRVVDGRWWPGPPVQVRAARRSAESSATHGPISGPPGTPVAIRFAAGQATVATAAHELAHALAGVGHGHDAVYLRAYLDVIEVITNLDPTDRRGGTHTRQLADAFRAAGLSVAPRVWPAPAPTDGGGAIAL